MIYVLYPVRYFNSAPPICPPETARVTVSPEEAIVKLRSFLQRLQSPSLLSAIPHPVKCPSRCVPAYLYPPPAFFITVLARMHEHNSLDALLRRRQDTWRRSLILTLRCVPLKSLKGSFFFLLQRCSPYPECPLGIPRIFPLMFFFLDPNCGDDLSA